MYLPLVILPFAALLLINLPFGRWMKGLGFLFALFMALYQTWSVFSRFNQGILWGVDRAGDSLSQLILLSIGLVVFIALIVGRKILVDEFQRFNFVNLILIGLIGMNAIVMVADFFALYVFMEVTAIASFILIGLRRDRFGLEGSFKYLILSAVATIFMLAAIAILFFMSGDTSFSAASSALRDHSSSVLIKAAIGFFLCGLFLKSGMVPFHGWVPDAYCSAPTPVTVLLAGIITKVCGVYVLARIVLSVIGINLLVQHVLTIVGTLSIIVGALGALKQTNFKRMLAYSSISQMGYIVLALGCGTPLAITGALFHFFNHAVFKSLLFVNAASLEKELGTLDMDKMGGLSAKMPFTNASALAAFLSTAGVPPLSGFWSKLIIIIALWSAGMVSYAVIALLASLLTLAYFLFMQRKVFFGKLGAGLENVRESSATIIFAQVILTVVTVGIGIFYSYFLNVFILPVKNIM